MSNLSHAFNIDPPSPPSAVTPLREDAGVSWVHPELLAISNSASGVGVVTNMPLAAGTLLAVYGGIALDKDNLGPVNEEMRQYFYQLHPSIWYGPGTDPSSLGIGERFNHACQPNSGFIDPVTMVALRNIPAGTEVTVDYAKFQSNELEGSSFDCRCGCPGCRSKVEVTDWRLIQSGSQEYTSSQPFIQAMIDPDGSSAAKLFARLRFPAAWGSPWSSNGYARSFLASPAVTVEGGKQIVRAVRAIAQDEVLFVGGGRVVANEQLMTIEQNLRPLFAPFREGFMVGPRHEQDVGSIHYLRDPSNAANVERVLGVFIRATRAINQGEKIVGE